MSKPVYILNGPNLNLLGKREPEIYGSQTLADIEAATAAEAKGLKLSVTFRQTNHEGELIELVHEARDKACGILINAGGLTHTCVALHDSLRMADVPVIEVLVKEHKVGFFILADEEPTINRKKFVELCEELVKRGATRAGSAPRPGHRRDGAVVCGHCGAEKRSVPITETNTDGNFVVGLIVAALAAGGGWYFEGTWKAALIGAAGGFVERGAGALAGLAVRWRIPAAGLDPERQPQLLGREQQVAPDVMG